MLFFKTTTIVALATLVTALSVPEVADRALVQRNTCLDPEGHTLSCPDKYWCVGGRGCCLKTNMNGWCYFKRDGGHLSERELTDAMQAHQERSAEIEGRDLEERVTSCKGPDGYIVKCYPPYYCAGGKGCCRTGDPICHFRRGLDERDMEPEPRGLIEIEGRDVANNRGPLSPAAARAKPGQQIIREAYES